MKSHETGFWAQTPVRRWLLLAAIFGLGAVLASCGGGGGGSPGTTSNAGAVFSGPISGFGSIVVGGVRIDDSSATVTMDDEMPASSGDLKLGMMVEVQGTRSADGLRGTASSIHSSSKVQGPITAVDAANRTIAVLGVTISVPTTTVFEDVTDFAALAALPLGTMVEVHGMPDGTNPDAMTATRIEAKPGETQARLTGTVANLDTVAQTFTLHGTLIQYARAINNNLPALANGLTVRVRGPLTTAATAVPATIDADRVRIRKLDMRNNMLLQIEGNVTVFTSPSSFEIDGTVVSVPGTAIVEGTVALGTRVEVKGTVDANGVLIAAKVEVEGAEDEAENEFHGTVSALDAAAGTFTLTTAGGRTQAVSFGLNTLFDAPLTAATLANGNFIEVKGTVTGTTLLAASIELETS